MTYPGRSRPLAGATALAVIALGLGPAVSAHRQGGNTAAVPTHVSLPAHVILHGTLVALHRARRLGDLVLASGDLIPLRFASAAQERHLRIGDGLDIAADAHGHARLLVHALRDAGFGSHWTGSHWTGSHWTGKTWTGSHWTGKTWTGSHWTGSHWTGSHWTGSHWSLHGVVTRVLGHGQAEVTGLNGASVVVGTSGMHVAGQPGAGAPALFAPSTAYADAAPAVRPGESIDAAVTLTHAGAMTLSSLVVVANRVARIDVEGTITAVHRASGTVTLSDENGELTVVTLGQAAAGYRVGQNIEVSGTLHPASHSGATTMQAQSAEHEPAAPHGSGAPEAETATPTAAPASAAPVATVTAAAPVATGTVIPPVTPATSVPSSTLATPPTPPTRRRDDHAKGGSRGKHKGKDRQIATPTALSSATAPPLGSATAATAAPTHDDHDRDKGRDHATPTGVAAQPVARATAMPTATPTAMPTATPRATPGDDRSKDKDPHGAAPTATAQAPAMATPTLVVDNPGRHDGTATTTIAGAAMATATATATPTSTVTPTALPIAVVTPTLTAMATTQPTSTSLEQHGHDHGDGTRAPTATATATA